MSLFFETVKVKDSKIFNIKFHNKRMNETIMKAFSKKANFDLKDFISPPKDRTLYRCKVIYNTKIVKIDFYPYKTRNFKNLICVDSKIDYSLKSTNRKEFEKLLNSNKNFDDIIIIKDNLVTDTSIANIAIYDGLKWFTPKTPLLKGTLRASLIEKNLLEIKDFGKNELKSSVKIAIMNAMIGFYELKDIKIRY